MGSADFHRDRLAEAGALLGKHRKDVRDADSLSSRPRIMEEHATSRNEQRRLELCSVSLNDILDAANESGLLQDPIHRERFLRLSRSLNSLDNRF